MTYHQWTEEAVDAEYDKWSLEQVKEDRREQEPLSILDALLGTAIYMGLGLILAALVNSLVTY